MYSFIEGKIELKQDNKIVLSNNGIGYEIFVSNNTLANIGNVGDIAKIYTYLHVREDAFLLYGFENLTEKQMFLDLTNVSGIGAKMAINILSGISVRDLLNAIATGDVKLLSTVKGIGKKTAERIVLELKGSFADSELLELLHENVTANNPFSEAVEVLVSMGIQRISANQLVKAVSLPGDSVENIIQKCLKNM
jgi:Holliday junction DNA helicase RuvA